MAANPGQRRSLFGWSVLLVVGPLMIQCGLEQVWAPGAFEDGPTGNNTGETPTTLQPACDPDGIAPCTSDWFACVTEDDGGKLCRGQQPAVPSTDQRWDCSEQGTTLVCEGERLPGDASAIWACEEAGDSVVCRAHAYLPDVGSSWNCHYDGDFRVCEDSTTGEPTEQPGASDEIEGTGGDDDSPAMSTDQPDGGTTGDGTGDDLGGGGSDQGTGDDLGGGGSDQGTGDDLGGSGSGSAPPGCLCVPGASRYCDTPTYCRWGVQYCAADGLSWGTCTETTVPPQCSWTTWYSPQAEECCIASGMCCQDMWDRDRDGDTWESMGNCIDIVCAP